MNASHIGPGHRVEGTISSGEDIIISGRVRGKILCDATATVAPGALVEATVTARTVIIHGAVVGNVEAADLIEVAATGQVRGDLKARQIALKPGGRVLGGIATAMDVSVPRSATRTGRSQRPTTSSSYSAPPSRSFDSFGSKPSSTPTSSSYSSSSYSSSSSSFASGTTPSSSASSFASTPKPASSASDPWATMSSTASTVDTSSSAFDLKSVLDEVIGQHSSDLPTETDPAMSVVAPPEEESSLPVVEERPESEPF